VERRVLIAVFLCFVSLYLWQTLVVKPIPKPLPSVAQTVGKSPGGPAPGGSPATPQVATSGAARPEPEPSAVPETAQVVGEASERDIQVETRDVVAVFTNRGARLKSWRLKHYLDRDQQPQELVVSQVESQPLPFTLQVPDPARSALLNRGLYAVSGTPTGPSAAQEPTRLRFEYAASISGGGDVRAVKEFELQPTGYIVTFSTNVASPYTVQWGPAVGDISENSRYVKKAGGLYSLNKNVTRKAPKDFASQPTYEGDFDFVGVDDNYFMTVALGPGSSRVSYQAIAIPPPAGSKDPPRELVAFSLEPTQGNEPIRFFGGPKDFDVLTAIGGNLREAIDFGMFRIIVVPLLSSLKGINRFVGNYGWSIIILTIIINAIMFPLRHKSVVSMRKMQEIQPEVKSIQDRYAKYKTTDPARQKMNQELMTLYKERGVNPASGCVPMLLTMPVLVAFYALLSTAIELRGAPFVGWIHDLSLHDPFYVTPVLMGATMVWQQKLAPAAGVDPTQQKMMMVMPVVFTFMFLWAPAGVAVYWLMSNLWGIGQQYLTNYLIGPPAVRTVRPAAERQIKRVGAAGKN
jgi:YidC/Oxa1 family membrane protein insertase